MLLISEYFSYFIFPNIKVFVKRQNQGEMRKS